MTHVVTKPCDGCRYTDCVVVCPVSYTHLTLPTIYSV